MLRNRAYFGTARSRKRDPPAPCQLRANSASLNRVWRVFERELLTPANSRAVSHRKVTRTTCSHLVTNVLSKKSFDRDFVEHRFRRETINHQSRQSVARFNPYIRRKRRVSEWSRVAEIRMMRLCRGWRNKLVPGESRVLNR